jgi:gas vesicle protein
MELSVIFEALLGGGLVTAVAGLLTMRSTARKAQAEADSARAEAAKVKAEVETVQLTNTENATRILMDNIVKPLQRQLDETRKYLEEAKREIAKNTREMARLRKSIDAANSCHYSDDCPVLRRVRREEERDRRDAAGQQPADDDAAGQPQTLLADGDPDAGACSAGDADGGSG